MLPPEVDADWNQILEWFWKTMQKLHNERTSGRLAFNTRAGSRQTAPPFMKGDLHRSVSDFLTAIEIVL